MRRHVSKVFLDSRYHTQDGRFEIPGEALLLNPTSRIWLGEFTCVAAWATIDSSNDLMIVREGPGNTAREIFIPRGPHDLNSLRAALETELNADKEASMGDYTVELVSTGAGGGTYRAYRVTCTAGFFKLDPGEGSMSSILRFPSGDIALAQHTSSFIDLRRTHSIYIHTDLGGHNCISPIGKRGVLAKIPVTVGYGGLVHATMSGSEHDFVEAGCHALSTLRLSLHDAAGNELDLSGTAWSCTLIIEK